MYLFCSSKDIGIRNAEQFEDNLGAEVRRGLRDMGIRLHMVDQRAVFRVGDFFLPGRLIFLHVAWPLIQVFDMPTMAQLFQRFLNHLHPAFQWVAANNLFEPWWADIILHPIRTNFQMHAPPHQRVGGGRCFLFFTFHWKGFCAVLLFEGIFEEPPCFFEKSAGG